MARERQQHFIAAIWIFTADTRESVAQIAAIQESIDDLADNRPPEAMFIGEAIVVNMFEFIEVVFDQSVK